MKPVCVITGGGSGMGRATAKLVCEAGYHVILVGRSRKTGKRRGRADRSRTRSRSLCL